MKLTVTGSNSDSLAEVGERFEATWQQVLATYREEPEADDTRPF